MINEEIMDLLVSDTMNPILMNKGAFWQAFIDIQKETKSISEDFLLVCDKHAKVFYLSL